MLMLLLLFQIEIFLESQPQEEEQDEEGGEDAKDEERAAEKPKCVLSSFL
jgi:hypothetical protein